MRSAPSHRLDPENEERTMTDRLWKPNVEISSSSIMFPLVRYLLTATRRVVSNLKAAASLGSVLRCPGQEKTRAHRGP